MMKKDLRKMEGKDDYYIFLLIEKEHRIRQMGEGPRFFLYAQMRENVRIFCQYGLIPDRRGEDCAV